VIEFQEVEQEGKVRSAVRFSYSTTESATNQFEADIVYALETDLHMIASPLGAEVIHFTYRGARVTAPNRACGYSFQRASGVGS